MSWAETLKINSNMNVALNELLEEKTEFLSNKLNGVNGVTESVKQSVSNCFFQASDNLFAKLSSGKIVNQETAFCPFVLEGNGQINIEVYLDANCTVVLREKNNPSQVIANFATGISGERINQKVDIRKNTEYEFRLTNAPANKGVSSVLIYASVVNLNLIEFEIYK